MQNDWLTLLNVLLSVILVVSNIVLQTSWHEQELVMREENRHLESRCSELEEQNKLLHTQMESVSVICYVTSYRLLMRTLPPRANVSLYVTLCPQIM